jgi:hypothetical protein
MPHYRSVQGTRKGPFESFASHGFHWPSCWAAITMELGTEARTWTGQSVVSRPTFQVPLTISRGCCCLLFACSFLQRERKSFPSVTAKPSAILLGTAAVSCDDLQIEVKMSQSRNEPARPIFRLPPLIRHRIYYTAPGSLAPLFALTPPALSSLAALKVVLNQASCHQRIRSPHDEDCCLYLWSPCEPFKAHHRKHQLPLLSPVPENWGDYDPSTAAARSPPPATG